MYKFIVNPKDNKKYDINSIEGKDILNNYLDQIGGEYVGKGTYKCVFSPPIKCLGENKRYTGDDEYISSITSYEDLTQQLKIEKIKKKIDPKNKFTLKLLKYCKIGELDPISEGIGQFNSCSNPYSGNFLQNYNYPYTNYKGTHKWDLRLMITKYGGGDLNKILDDIQYKTDLEVSRLLPKLYIKFINVIKGVKTIIKNKLIHSDIKPGNILYDEKNNKFYIIDFGLMKKFNEVYKSKIYIDYTINMNSDDLYYRYWPYDSGIACSYLLSKSGLPKIPVISTVLKDKQKIIKLYKKYNKTSNKVKNFIKKSKEKFDVFSLGVTMLEFFFSFQIESVLKKTLKKYPNNSKLISINNINNKLRKLIDKMIDIDPVSRVSIDEVITTYKNLIKTIDTKKSRKTQNTIKYLKKCKNLRKNKFPKCNDQFNCEWTPKKGCNVNNSPSPSTKK